MSDAPRWRRYLRFWGPNVDADIDDELRFHLEARAAEYAAAGVSPDEARRRADERFGNASDIRRQLHVHDMSKLTWQRRADFMDELLQDLRYGLRKLRQAPGFTAAVVAVLALGIGANTAIFSAIDAVFLRPLPFQKPARLVRISGIDVPFALGPQGGPQSEPYPADAAATGAFSSVAVSAVGGLNLTGGREPMHVAVGHVTIDFFKTLGRFPRLGRTFSAEEERAGGPHAAILSDRLWRNQFGGDSSVIGRRVTLNDVPYTVVGVMPPAFTYPSNVDLWAPLPTPIGWDVLEVFKSFVPTKFIARLAPGVTPPQAAAALAATERRFPNWKHMSDTSATSLVKPLQQSLVPQDRRAPLFILMGCASLVLLIACANVVNLLLSRAAVRQRELAVRRALGATRGRVVRQLLVETMLLTLAGACCGAVVAGLASQALTALLPADLVAISPPRLDARLLGYAFALAVAAGVVVGLWPALGATTADLAQAVGSGDARSTSERGGVRLRGALTVTEVALALMLLVGAGLMLESLHALLNTDSGMDSDRVATVHVTLPSARYRGAAATNAFYAAVLANLRAIPGVAGAAVVTVLPLAQQNTIGLMLSAVDGRPVDPNRSLFPMYLQASSGYFGVMGIHLLRGRDIDVHDDTSTHAAVINRAMADSLWPGHDPIGRHFTFGPSDRVVVGVVSDVRSDRLDRAAPLQMYFPLQEGGWNDANIVVRGSLPASALLARIRDAVRAVDPAQAIYGAQSMSDVISASVASRRLNTVLVTIFGALALALAAIGVYAVLAYSVARRTREIGVRIALGAQSGDVLRLVFRQGLGLTVLGVVIGLAGALALARFIRAMLYDVAPTDPRVLISAPFVLLVVALAAVWIPARRATRVDPMDALRHE